VLSKHEIDEAYNTISRWDNYSPTPLISLNKLSEKLKLNKIFYKDESKRFHLKSFKALGGSYAVEKVTKGNKEITVSTATAGNHGRSVAWGSKKLGLKCKIFATPFTAVLIKEKFKEKKIEIGNNLRIVDLNGNIELGPFNIEFITLTHSILEPNGLSIKTPVGTVLHTGDWKCDPNPLIGNTINQKKLKDLFFKTKRFH